MFGCDGRKGGVAGSVEKDGEGCCETREDGDFFLDYGRSKEEDN